MKTVIFAIALVLILLIAAPVQAGPGANMNGCINVTHPELIGKVAIFEPSPSYEDMSQAGHGGEVKLEGQGLHCASVGYVEAIRGGNLWASKWTLAYRIVTRETGTDGKPVEHQTRFSGSVTTQWSFSSFFGGNKIWRDAGPDSTKICNAKVLCSSNEVTWAEGTQGPLYINFDPIKN